MRVRSLSAALAVGLVAALFSAGPASAQATLTVHAGGGFGQDEPAGTARMMAPEVDGVATIQIHSNDVIHFVGTPLLLPQGQEPIGWYDENGRALDSPWGNVQSDPDGDGQGIDAPNKFNLRPFSSTLDNCGDSESNPCSFDGSNSDPVAGVMNPGDEVDGYYVKITASPNDTIYATTLPAVTHTFLKIEVVPNGQDGTTQQQIDDAKKTLLAKEKSKYNHLVNKLSKPTFTREGSHRVYDAYAGYDTATIRILKMMPEKLHIRKGDTVRWHFHLVGEPHTATFPFKKGENVSNNGFVPECDPDGQDGDGPDTEADLSGQGPPCPEGSELEFDVTRSLTAQSGDGTFPGGSKSFESSGVRGGNIPSGEGLAGGTGAWPLRFPKTSSDKGNRYLCGIHGRFMSGWVIVE
jgi:hypothetical protein